MPGHGAGFAGAARAGGDGEVPVAVQDGPAEQGELVGPVGAVAVHEGDDGAGRVGSLRPHVAGTAVAAAAVQHGGTCRPGTVRRAVAAAAVGDDDLADALGEAFRHHRTDAVGLVPGWDDHGDL